MTMVGAGFSNPVSQRGMNLKEGTEADLHNVLLMGFSDEAINTKANEDNARTMVQVIQNSSAFTYSLFYEAGANRTTWCDPDENTPKTTDDEGFDECAWIQGQPGNQFDVPPNMPNEVYDAEAPDFVPNSASSPLFDGTAPPDDGFFDRGADYIGAIEPLDGAPWYEGWTAFPEL